MSLEDARQRKTRNRNAVGYTDIRLLIDPKLIYIIVSLLDGTKMIKGFRIRDGKVEEEQLIIEENRRE